ncbi:MAG: ribonuclease HII [Candidatus Paceibacterota bacterium]|jgi:ribonuclease HII
MIIPDFSREEKLFNKGYRQIAGIDEVGRGPLAGPLVAAAVVFSHTAKISDLVKMGVRDSKLLTSKKREYLYEKIVEKCRDWSVSVIPEDVIDEINILQATLLAMRRAVESLKVKPDFLLIDGNFTIDDYPVSQLAVPKADQHIFSVSAASVLAKVTRDRILVDLDQKYPEYGFAKHKGYGTREHMEALKKHGPCIIHRKSFGPIDRIIKKFNGSGLAK